MSGSRKWTKSLRLEFRFESLDIVLESQTRVDILPPPSDPIEEMDEYTGYYLKLTDPRDNIFYFRKLQNPFRTQTESYGVSAESPISHETLKAPDPTFSVLVPDPGFVFTLEVINKPPQPEVVFDLAALSFTFTIDPAEVIFPSIVVAGLVENGTILGKEKIVDHGSDGECWTIAIFAEGYRADEMPKFLSDADKFINFFKNFPPFNEFWPRTNVYILKVASTDSGADLPAQCQGGAPPVDVRTYFNASFCGAVNNKRLLVIDRTTAKKVWSNRIPEAHVAFAMVNSVIYGGSGGEVAVFSTNSESALIGIHELGHSFFNLADEYEFPFVDFNPENYPNVTAKTQLSQIKWRDLIAPATPVPTSRNQCAGGGPFTHDVLDGTVGLFEGALYKTCNVFRPEKNCLMRDFEKEQFCAVCTRAIRTKLAQLLGVDLPNV
jgi:hypothetical protein